MTDAIWRGDVETVRRMVTRDPRLLHEAARGLPDSNWGPPMSYAANIGQDAIIEMLRGLGATLGQGYYLARPHEAAQLFSA